MYDEAGHAAALAVTDAIFDDLVRAVEGDREAAVVGAAPAGGGKTHFVVETSRRLIERGVSVIVAAPTNDQVVEIVERMQRSGLDVAHLHKSDYSYPDHLDPSGFHHSSKLGDLLGDRLIVTTVSKLGFALNPKGDPPEIGDRLLILDEAYQVKSADYLRIAGPFRVHLLVGDPGQLDPFTTLSEPYWRGQEEDPLATAVEVVLANHLASGRATLHRFPLTRRLDPSGADLARPFYGAQHSFGAWVREGVRALVVPDRAPNEVQVAAASGWSYATLPDHKITVRDTQMAKTIAHAAAGLIGSVLTREVPGQQVTEQVPLRPRDVIIGVTRNEQRLLILKALRSQKVTGVRVLTANKAQGLECAVSLVWHPLSGRHEVSEFELDSGRLCVLLTRHKHACVVYGREGDAALVSGVPPASAAYPSLPDSLLQGWYSHVGLMTKLTTTEGRHVHVRHQG